MTFPKKTQEYIGDKISIKDAVGKSASGVYLFDDMVLKISKIDCESANEVQMLSWLKGKVPVPSIIEHINENECSYLLMSKCKGKMACDPYYMSQPKKLVELLAEALHRLWSVDVSECPCQWSLQRRLEIAEDNVALNLVDIDDAQPNTFGPKGFRDPEQLLHWLKDNQPEQEQALSHGDFCLPNIFLSDSGATGFIDLGKSGIADPWQDIALCCRTLDNNYSGMYDGNRYTGYDQQMLFDALGIKPEPERIRYYILLDELF